MFPESVRTPKELEGWPTECLQHLKQALDTAGLRAILVHEDAPQVKKARVLVHLVQLYHLRDKGLEQGMRLPTHASHGKPDATAAALHDPCIFLVAVACPREHGPHLLYHWLAWMAAARAYSHGRVPAREVGTPVKDYYDCGLLCED